MTRAQKVCMAQALGDTRMRWRRPRTGAAGQHWWIEPCESCGERCDSQVEFDLVESFWSHCSGCDENANWRKGRIVLAEEMVF